MNWTPHERMELTCTIYTFFYECKCGYEDSAPYETAETILNIYHSLDDPEKLKQTAEQVLDQLDYYCTTPAKELTHEYLADTDYVRMHRANGLEIVKAIMTHLPVNRKQADSEKDSVLSAMGDMEDAMYRLSLAWDNNIEGVNLNELDANEIYPFDGSFDSMLNLFAHWYYAVIEEVRRNQ